MNLNITVIRVDPNSRIIAAIKKPFGRNATRGVAELVRAKEISPRQLLVIEEKRLYSYVPQPGGRPPVMKDIGGTPLVVAAGVATDEARPMWRLRGTEDTGGIGVLFGLGSGGGMIDCPVDVAWVEERIVWTAGESIEQLQERADAAVDILDPSITAVLKSAIDAGPFADGDTTMWMDAAAAGVPELTGAMMALGFTDESSGGRRLTRLGAAVREILINRETCTVCGSVHAICQCEGGQA